MPRAKHRAHAIGMALALLAVCGCSAGETPTPAARPAECPGVTLTRTGDQHRAVDRANDRGTWDLRGAVWDEVAPSRIEYPVRSDDWTQGCVIGGTIRGDIPRRWTRDQWYDGLDGATALGGDAFALTMTTTSGNFVSIRDAYVLDYEDAYDPNSPRSSFTTYLDHVRAKYIRDDCIENEDVPHNMVVTNSLLECFTAFAQRPSGLSSARNGQGSHRFTVVSSLVHIRPQRLGPEYCDDERVDLGRCKPTATPNVWLGAYGIWKWSKEAASRVTVRDTIFRLDMPSYSSCSSQEWPRGSYENVTLVWTGRGRYRNAGDCDNRLPPGVRLTRDVGVWRKAKAAWLRD